MAANKVQKSRDDAMAAERIRQQGLDREVSALNVASQDRYQDFGAKQDERSKELGDYFSEQQIEATGANATASDEMVMPQAGSEIVVQEEAKQRGNARDFTNKSAAALGNLRSFGDYLGGIGRGQARDASEIGILGGFKRGSSGVLPMELEAANQAGNGAKMFGDVLNLGGGVLTSAGLSKPSTTGRGYFPDAPRAPGASLYSIYGSKKGLF